MLKLLFFLVLILNIILGRGAGTIKRNVEDPIDTKPSCRIENIYALHGEEVTFKCVCLAFPKAEIIWNFKYCREPGYSSCQRYFISINNKTIDTNIDQYSQKSEITFIAENHGFVKCNAKNTQGYSTVSAILQVSDISEPLKIFGIDENKKIAVGDEIKLECRASKSDYTDNIQWLKNKAHISNGNGLSVINLTTKFSYGSSLYFKAIRKRDEGEYTCEVLGKSQSKLSLSKNLKIFDAQLPSIKSSFMQNEISKLTDESLRLECFADGLPTPVVTWKKNGISIMLEENTQRLTFRNNNMILEFIALTQEDSGHYECFAENRIGKVEKSIHIQVESGRNHNIVIGSFAVFILLILLLLLAWLKLFMNKKLIAELKAAGLENFEEGNLNCVSSDFNLDEQADLLPYDKTFEFPRDKLQLKKQLGAGAFGVVYEGIAIGIVKNESETVVAVKMVKKQAGNEVIKALVSELKILIHLGQHLNIVNLLGAVTKNVARKELMVIFEYCKYGNLQSFLVSNRLNFINQIRNGKIAPVLKEDESSKLGTAAKSTSQGLKFVRVSIINDKTNPESNKEDPNQSTENKVPESDVRTSLCTSDLVCWAFQIARGMEYLSRSKIIHGDLAARNILLCDNNVVKICDFGLSKSIYKNDIYKRRGQNLLPFKWLSLEAISDSVYSVYSDVWSYGIMLWEFFSLGTVPYPGMDANENLFYKIREGYRMEKPDFATQDIYDIMLNCWNVVPESRPLFSELERKFSSLMVKSVKNHYIVMNDKYVRANAKNEKGNACDYLQPLSVKLNNSPKPSTSQQINHYIESKASNFSDSLTSKSQSMINHVDDTKVNAVNLSPKFDESTNVPKAKNDCKLQFQNELRLKLLKRPLTNRQINN